MQTHIVEPKPGIDVGQILVDMHLKNYEDLTLAGLGMRPTSDVRTLNVQALVDTRDHFLSLPAGDIALLGLRPIRRRHTRSVGEVIMQQIYSPVAMIVQGRDCMIEVAEVPDGMPALLGLIPLELMDYWIDTQNRRLVGNPEHGGEWMVDAF
jgi:hypothetical protein